MAHKRRREAAIERQRRDGIRVFHDATCGLIELVLVRAESAPRVYCDDSVLGRAFARSVAEFYATIDRHQCVLCGASFALSVPIDWGIVLPARAKTARDVIASAICWRCSDAQPDDRKLIVAINDELRRSIWPSLREVEQWAAELPTERPAAVPIGRVHDVVIHGDD